MKITVQQIIESYEDFKTLSYPELKEKYNLEVDYTTYYARLKKLGLQSSFKPIGGHSKISDETILTMYNKHIEEKLPIREISNLLGLSECQFRKRLEP